MLIRIVEFLAIGGFALLAFLGVQIVKGGKRSALIISALISIGLLIYNTKLEEETGRGIARTIYCKVAQCKVDAPPDPLDELRTWLASNPLDNGQAETSAARLSDATMKFGRQPLVDLAETGHTVAALLVGRGFAEGLSGFPTDLRKAKQYYRIAADADNARAQNNLGLLYKSGTGDTRPDLDEAARLFKLASDQGLAIAQVNLAELYREGLVTSPGEGEALRLYKLAAAQGNALGEFHFGVMLWLGEKVAQDRSRGLSLLESASDKGVAMADYNLGLIYEQGLGDVVPDRSEAVRRYQRAANGGIQAASERLRSLEAAN